MQDKERLMQAVAILIGVCVVTGLLYAGALSMHRLHNPAPVVVSHHRPSQVGAGSEVPEQSGGGGITATYAGPVTGSTATSAGGPGTATSGGSGATTGQTGGLTGTGTTAETATEVSGVISEPGEWGSSSCSACQGGGGTSGSGGSAGGGVESEWMQGTATGSSLDAVSIDNLNENDNTWKLAIPALAEEGITASVTYDYDTSPFFARIKELLPKVKPEVEAFLRDYFSLSPGVLPGFLHREVTWFSPDFDSTVAPQCGIFAMLSDKRTLGLGLPYPCVQWDYDRWQALMDAIGTDKPLVDNSQKLVKESANTPYWGRDAVKVYLWWLIYEMRLNPQEYVSAPRIWEDIAAYLVMTKPYRVTYVALVPPSLMAKKDAKAHYDYSNYVSTDAEWDRGYMLQVLLGYTDKVYYEDGLKGLKSPMPIPKAPAGYGDGPGYNIAIHGLDYDDMIYFDEPPRVPFVYYPAFFAGWAYAKAGWDYRGPDEPQHIFEFGWGYNVVGAYPDERDAGFDRLVRELVTRQENHPTLMDVFSQLPAGRDEIGQPLMQIVMASEKNAKAQILGLGVGFDGKSMIAPVITLRTDKPLENLPYFVKPYEDCKLGGYCYIVRLGDYLKKEGIAYWTKRRVCDDNCMRAISGTFIGVRH